MTAVQENDTSEAPFDGWTDDQESGLLRACVQWKPVGMHKHFRMIAIRNQLINEGLISETDEHTSTAGIWKKLKIMYDLPRLDEREDSEVSDKVDAGTQGYWRDFELPRDDFESMMWERRLAPDGTSSPEMSRRESTVADTDEPRSSPVPGKSAGRGGRAGARKSGRLSRLQNEVETESPSQAASVADEDHPMGEADEEEDSSDEEEEETEEEENNEDRRSAARRGGRGGTRGRAARRGRRRG
jgi:MRG-binding protein